MDKNDLTVLVTGASRGIGMYLAHEFAAGGHPLLLVAPDQTELQAVADQLGKDYGADVEIVGCDLEQAEGFARLERVLAGRDVDILVNNAGQGFLGRFAEVALERHLATVRLNIEAVLRLSARLLPGMIARDRGGLLNVASITSFEPGPRFAVYHATKAFILSWSESLATELADTGLSVTALCPGPTDTDFFVKAGMENTRAFQQSNLMAPQEVAKIGYEAFSKGERVAIAGTVNKLMVASSHLLPEQLLAAKNQMMYQDAPPELRTRHRGDREFGQGGATH
jgi:uncharacterized protein